MEEHTRPSDAPDPATRRPLPLQGADQRVLAPLIRQRQRRGPLFGAAAVAAAAVIVAVGGSALHLNKRGDATAIIGETPGVTSMVTSGVTSGVTEQIPTRTGAAAGERIHIQLSSTDYREDTLTEQARHLLDFPGPALRPLAAEAPTIGPIGTERGLQECLEAASYAGKERYVVDLATYEGQPAAVIAGHEGSADTVIVVARNCGAGDAGVLKHTTRVP